MKNKKIKTDTEKIELMTRLWWAMIGYGKARLRERSEHQKECTICQNEIKNSEEKTRKLSRG